MEDDRRRRQSRQPDRLPARLQKYSSQPCHLGDSAALSASDGHTHGEAYIYFIEGKGYSIVGDQRVEWGPSYAMYVPPDTFHQHFVTSDTPVEYLRVIPSPFVDQYAGGHGLGDALFKTGRRRK